MHVLLYLILSNGSALADVEFIYKIIRNINATKKFVAFYIINLFGGIFMTTEKRKVERILSERIISFFEDFGYIFVVCIVGIAAVLAVIIPYKQAINTYTPERITATVISSGSAGFVAQYSNGYGEPVEVKITTDEVYNIGDTLTLEHNEGYMALAMGWSYRVAEE